MECPILNKYFMVSSDKRFYPPMAGNDLYTYSDHVNYKEQSVTLLSNTNYSKAQLIKNNSLIMEKYFRCIEGLGTELNSLFQEDLTPNFWKKSLSLAFKRYLSILHMAFIEFSHFDKKEYKIYAVLSQDCYFIPEDFEDQREFLQNTDLGREQLFSIYISTFHSDIFESAVKIRVNLNRAENASILSTVKFNFLRIKAICSRENVQVRVGVLDSFFSKENSRKLTKNRHISTLYIKNIRSKHSLSSKRTSLGSSFEVTDLFDNYYKKSLQSLFPRFFIENFEINKKHYISEIEMYPSLKYIICEAWISSTRDSFILALAKENKNVLHVYSEHNSLFHPFLGNNTELTASMVDTYYTIGWESDRIGSDIDVSNIKSGASLFFQEPISKRIPDKGQFLFMDVATFGYLEEYNTYYSESDFFSKYYFQFLKDFFSELSGNLKTTITYREYPVGGRNWKTYDNKVILKEYLPSNLIIDDMGFSGHEMMIKSELNIIPYTNTAYIQSLILDIPTIFFWNKSVAHLHGSYLDFFDVLIDVGICQTSPREAAKFLCSIEHDVQGWWLNEDTKLARKLFLSKNIKNPDNAFDFYNSLANF